MSDDLRHLDERVAAVDTAWRPVARERFVDEDPIDEPVDRLAKLLLQLAARMDTLERGQAERDVSMMTALGKGWSELAERLTAIEVAFGPAAASVDIASARLRATSARLEERHLPLQHISDALDGIRSTLRAQGRVLEALYEVSSSSPATADVQAEIAFLRDNDEALGKRVREIEQWLGAIADEPPIPSDPGD